jgi:hypothetical protein
MGSSNYPETLGNCYIVNAPWVFNLLWSAISPMLKQSTQDKILVCGADYKEVLSLYQHVPSTQHLRTSPWQVLLKNIDAANLPVFLGGTCACPGGCCPALDEEAFMTEQTVAAGKVFSIKQKVLVMPRVFALIACLDRSRTLL